MPPKIKITKEDIINAAFEIVKRDGADSINARNVASYLGCSTQPVFSNFDTMEQLKLEVVKRADAMCEEYITQEIKRGEYPDYKASGMAYIRFAKEQKELFRLLYMRNRSEEKEDTQFKLNNRMEGIVHKNTGLSGDSMALFHLEMWAYVHGIASMLATGFLDLDEQLISKMLTDCYQGFKKQYEV